MYQQSNNSHIQGIITIRSYRFSTWAPTLKAIANGNPIVSCISTIVVPSNLSIIVSIDMEIYSSPLQHKSVGHLRYYIFYSHTFCIVEDILVLHDFKSIISHDLHVQSLQNFEGLL